MEELIDIIPVRPELLGDDVQRDALEDMPHEDRPLPHRQVALNDLADGVPELRLLGSLLGVLRTLILEGDEIAPLDPDFLSFRNVNTEADWAEVQRLAAHVGGER